MRKHSLVAVGIAALLLTGTAPGSDACGFVLSADHACCAPSAPESSSGCCAGTDVPTPPPAPEHDDPCDCIHPASTQAEMVVSTSPPALEKSLSPSPSHQAPASDVRPDASARTAAQLRSHAPPPVFLLDCAFLI